MSREAAEVSLPRCCLAPGLVDGMAMPMRFEEERVLERAEVVANDGFEALSRKFDSSRVMTAAVILNMESTSPRELVADGQG